jgi:pimeloyl-ACP methyl ester carboxylesterase
MTARSYQLIPVGEQAFEFEVMIYRDELSDRQPLFVLHSIEFPVAPSATFCEFMWNNGYQVIFARRSGYGRSSPLPKTLIKDKPIKSGATAIAEAAMLRALIVRLGLSKVVILAIGSSNPVVFRLVQIASEIEFSVFVNPMFNQEVWSVFSPVWFRTMLKQTIASKSGLQIATQGMKLLIRREPITFYKNILQKNPGDLDYVDRNEADYYEAGALALQTKPSLMYYDARMCLSHDPLLKESFFDGIDAAILIGRNTTDLWRNEMEKEAARLDLPIMLAPRGDVFCAYVSPETVLKTIALKGRTPALIQ